MDKMCQRLCQRTLPLLLTVMAMGAIIPTARGAFRRIPTTAVRDCDLRLARAQAIPHRCIQYENHQADAPIWSSSLGIQFGRLTVWQWQHLARTYGAWHHPQNVVPYQPKRHYRLMDFLPPLMQALDRHQFAQEVTPLAHHGLPEVRQPLPHDRRSSAVILAANCWGTLYEILRLAYQPRPQTFTVFTTASEPIHAILEQTSTPVVGAPQPGDIVLISSVNATENREYLHHAALVVDPNLFFEKAGAGDHVPYRLIDGATLQRMWNPAIFTIEYRRPHRHRLLRSPHQAFGLHSDWVLRHWPQLKALAPVLAHTYSVNQAIGTDNLADTTYLQMRSIALLASGRDRYRLPDQAYE